MRVIRNFLSSGFSSVRPGTFLTAALSAAVFVARAQTPQPPYALLEYSTLTGSGNRITATQIPVVTASGVTVYLNATLQFDVDSNGNLTLSPGFPQLSAAPTILASSFKAGRYVGPSTIANGRAFITVAGPGVSDGGATQWSLSTTTGSDPGTYPRTATWYVGPIASNPYAARLKNAGVTSTAWSYGVSNSPCRENTFCTNSLIGVSQIGNTITIVSFSGGSNGALDYVTPTDQITYTLAPAP